MACETIQMPNNRQTLERNNTFLNIIADFTGPVIAPNRELNTLAGVSSLLVSLKIFQSVWIIPKINLSNQFIAVVVFICKFKANVKGVFA